MTHLTTAVTVAPVQQWTVDWSVVAAVVVVVAVVVVAAVAVAAVAAAVAAVAVAAVAVAVVAAVAAVVVVVVVASAVVVLAPTAEKVVVVAAVALSSAAAGQAVDSLYLLPTGYTVCFGAAAMLGRSAHAPTKEVAGVAGPWPRSVAGVELPVVLESYTAADVEPAEAWTPSFVKQTPGLAVGQKKMNFGV